MTILRFLPYHIASHTIKGLVGLGVVVHILFFLRVIDGRYLWGGQVTDPQKLQVLEHISIDALLTILAIVLVQDDFVRRNRSHKLLTGCLWVISFLLFLNTIGNMMAVTLVEAILGTLVTATLSVCMARVAGGE